MLDLVIEIPEGVYPALLVVISAIGIDLVFGVLTSIKNKEFDIRTLPQFLVTGVLPYVGGLLVLAVAAERIGMFYYELFVGVSGLVVAKYVADLKDKVFELFGIGE